MENREILLCLPPRTATVSTCYRYVYSYYLRTTHFQIKRLRIRTEPAAAVDLIFDRVVATAKRYVHLAKKPAIHNITLKILGPPLAVESVKWPAFGSAGECSLLTLFSIPPPLPRLLLLPPSQIWKWGLLLLLQFVIRLPRPDGLSIWGPGLREILFGGVKEQGGREGNGRIEGFQFITPLTPAECAAGRGKGGGSFTYADELLSLSAGCPLY